MHDVAGFFDGVARTFDAWQRMQDGDGKPSELVAFYRELAREVDGPALEVGVGSGRVYLELLADGIDVDGIDLSADMLARLREKAETRGLDPSVRVADVTDFEPDREYGLVYAPRVFGHLSSLADQRAALQNVRAALAPGGLFALQVFVPDIELIGEEYGEPWEETVEVDGQPHRVVRCIDLVDGVEQVARWRWEVYHDGQLHTEGEVPLALIPKRQFELLFELAGFEDWTVYGDYDCSPLESTDQEMIWVAEA